jgi:DNA replication licensing factor MCM7
LLKERRKPLTPAPFLPHAELFASFLQEHQIQVTDNDNDGGDSDDDDIIPTAGTNTVRRVPCYPPLLLRIKDRNYIDEANPTFVVEIPLSEILAWDAVRGGDLAQRASKNSMRYQSLFCNVIDKTLENLPTSAQQAPARDTIDILHEQRMAQQAARDANRTQQENNPQDEGGVLNDEQNNANNNQHQASEEFPPLLMRRYELRILPLGRRGTVMPFDKQYRASKSLDETPQDGGVSLRFVRSRSMGRLVTIRGMIVRSSDVKPSCVVATYTCDACGCEVYQVIENKREFMPQRTCPSEECDQRPGSARMDTLHLQTRGSKFVKFQELKLQELPSQVPMGHIPRSMSVHCRGELTRLASPGDVVTIDGVFLPQRIAESGYRAMKAGLISTTYLDAQNIIVHKKSFDESLLGSLSEEESVKLEADIQTVSTGDDPIAALATAIAPEIFGHEDIKRSLLLQLVGGCTRKLPDGMRIRGDINICLMGDPGVAKSQLLKHVASMAPRGVYTTGKGSSGVGLTAAVTKDMTTGEMALEGGALVLADRGICAIDEFDKMDESDRTAIHEVMEQQTVSIAKAGIVATLNARAAVLAAANPLYGRYNRKKSLSENINLPNSLLSRFDLMFLILDIADVDFDIALARHVTFVHQNEGVKKSSDDSEKKDAGNDSDDEDAAEEKLTVTPRILREYIARARQHQPVVPPEVAPYIVEAYVNLRLEDRPGARGKKAGDQTAMTARQLLSILRLGQALARLRFSDYVAREDVDEAIRLTHMSKASLNSEDASNGSKRKRGQDITSKIFTTIRDYATSTNSSEVDLKMCEAMVLRKGYTAEQLQNCLEEYEELSVIQINSNRTQIHFL